MTCSRGKASPDPHTKLRLFADSGGYCQNPGCLRGLFVDADGANIHIAEMAHIFAANNDGPRAKVELSPEERGAYGNLILLCPSCHTIIDKAPESFPDVMIAEWKRSHLRRIAAAFGAVEYESRAATRCAIEPLLDENRAVFEQYGPLGEYRLNPESEMADVWARKVRSLILPNNRKVLAILKANRRHLRPEEREVLERFRQHVDDLEARHLGEGVVAVGATFPEEMSNILTEGFHD